MFHRKQASLATVEDFEQGPVGEGLELPGSAMIRAKICLVDRYVSFWSRSGEQNLDICSL